jgi:NAD(P)-dependent dehydrogenase (short-subunit alcohol dehydrogenase family)
VRILEIIATAKLKLNWAGTVKADKMAEAINAEGGTAIAVGGDVTKNEDIKTLVEKAAELGGGKINIINYQQCRLCMG